MWGEEQMEQRPCGAAIAERPATLIVDVIVFDFAAENVSGRWRTLVLMLFGVCETARQERFVPELIMNIVGPTEKILQCSPFYFVISGLDGVLIAA